MIALPDDCICSCFDADEETAFFGCEDGLIRVVDVATGQQVNQLTQLRDTFVEQLRFSRDQVFFLYVYFRPLPSTRQLDQQKITRKNGDIVKEENN